MSTEGDIINRVANSSLKLVELEKFIPEGNRISIDIKDQLWQGLALKEKDFRAFVKETDWSYTKDAFVAIYCSEDVIIPVWAYMLLSSAIKPHAKEVVFGTIEDLEKVLVEREIENFSWEEFAGAKAIVKGCSDKALPTAAYVSVMNKLQQHAQSIMFGEPCSTVPLWKQARKK